MTSPNDAARNVHSCRATRVWILGAGASSEALKSIDPVADAPLVQNLGVPTWRAAVELGEASFLKLIDPDYLVHERGEPSLDICKLAGHLASFDETFENRVKVWQHIGSLCRALAVVVTRPLCRPAVCHHLGSGLYVQLLERLWTARDVVIDFNWDPLLEWSLWHVEGSNFDPAMKFGVPFASAVRPPQRIGEQQSRDRHAACALVRPHGSISWVWEDTPESGGIYRYLWPDDVSQGISLWKGRRLFPAMALFGFGLRETQYRHPRRGAVFREADRRLREALNAAQLIISIGYSFGPDDFRWTGWWREASGCASWLVCDRSIHAARRLCTRIEEGSRVRDVRPIDGEFKDLCSALFRNQHAYKADLS